MKFKLISCIAIFLCSCSNSSKLSLPLPNDSLKKYSYAILGFSNISSGFVTPVGGTGFFIRYNNKLFFVTAKHVFNGCSYLSRSKEIVLPDKMNVLIEDSTGLPQSLIPIDIAKIRDTSNCEDPDIVVVEVENRPYINSVENFIRGPFAHVEDIYIYGFPGRANGGSGHGFVYARASEMHIKNGNKKFFQYIDSLTGKADTLNFILKDSNPSLFDSLGGFSGSPVFIQDKKSKHWRIGGAFVASSKETATNENVLLVTKIEEAIKQIRK